MEDDLLEMDFGHWELKKWDDIDQAVAQAISNLVEKGYLGAGDRVIVTMGDALGKEGGTNTLRLVQVGAGGAAENQNELDLR